MNLPTKLDVQRPSQKYMACPARFERASLALEEIVAVKKLIHFNDLGLKISTIQETVQCISVT
jgi:hypothetical protein